MKIHTYLFCLGLMGLFAGACSSSHYVAALSSVQADSLKQITDDEIRKALESRPQITLPTSIALYNASRDKFPFQQALDSSSNINRVVEISPSLLNPHKYYSSQFTSDWRRFDAPPQAIDLHQLRLYAAQAHTDLVLFVSSSSHIETQANILSSLYVGLITIPFVPGRTFKQTTYLEAYLIDVRNGLLYASYRDREIYRKKFSRLNASGNAQQIKDEHLTVMMPEFYEFVEQTLNNPSLQLRLISEN
jgi:hypothetical protein